LKHYSTVSDDEFSINDMIVAFAKHVELFAYCRTALIV